MPDADRPTPDPLAMSEEFETLSQLASSKEFLELLQDIGDASESERLEAAKRLATIDELKTRGVKVPPEMRLTLRYFEERPGNTVNAVTDTNEPAAPPESPVAPVSPEPGAPIAGSGWTVCATTGYISEGGVLVCSSMGRQMLQ